MSELIAPKLVKGVDIVPVRFGKAVRDRSFQYPHGEETFRVWGGNTEPAIIFPITAEGMVLAVNQFRQGSNCFVTEIPGGYPKPNQDRGELVQAELLEETGHRAAQIIWLTEKPIYFEPAACFTGYWPVLALDCVFMTDKLKLDKTEILGLTSYPLATWLAIIYKGMIRDSKSIVVTHLSLPHIVGRSFLPK